MTPLVVRLRATLLAGLFLAGALGMPLADAALFHLAGHDPYAGVTHVEAHGGQHHADRCTLAQPTAPQHESLSNAESIRATAPLVVRLVVAPAAVLHNADLFRLQHSRAPPA